MKLKNNFYVIFLLSIHNLWSQNDGGVCTYRFVQVQKKEDSIVFCSEIYDCKFKKTIHRMDTFPVYNFPTSYFRRDDKLIYTNPTQKVASPLSQASMIQFVKQHLKYPFPSNSAVNGVYVFLIIDETGSLMMCGYSRTMVEDPRYVKAALDLVKCLPQWIPAKVAGKPVAAIHTLKVLFDE